MDERARQNAPPRIAHRFLLWFLKEDLQEEVLGDLSEKFLLASEKSSPQRARLNYWLQVLNYLRPFAMRNIHSPVNIYPAMFGNYFKITFRSLFKQWKYTSINIVGLSISLSVVFLMLLWVNNEWKTDRFHENADLLYRAKRTIPLEGDRLDVYRNVSYPMMEAAAEQIPEVERYATVGFSYEDHLQVDEKVIRATGTFANADYFKVFSFPVLLGDVGQLDEKINSMVVTEDLALRFFGSDWRTKALGATIHIHDNADFSVEAVIANYPNRSSIQNDFLYSFQSYLKNNEWMLEWGNNAMAGVLQLKPTADPNEVANKIQTLFQAQQNQERKEGCILQKFEEDYLFSDFDDQAQVSGGRIEYVRIFLAAAFLLLFIACINFVNLATARASKRASEVGVRKTIGASRSNLILQFIVEALAITFVAVLVALLATRFLVPQLELITGKEITIEYTSPIFWCSILGLTFVTGLLAGAYPAFILSSFRPVNVLKGKAFQKIHGLSFRRVLVVVQFSLALLLIVSAMVVRKQIFYIQNTHLGLAKDNLLAIHQDEKVTAKYTVLKQTLEAHDAVSGVTVAGPNPHRMSASTSGVKWPKKRPDQENIEFAILWSAHNFPEVFDVPLASGRFYRESEYPDSIHIVLNEKAVEIMELGEDPIGQTIDWWGTPKQVIGVLKNFHNQSLYNEIQPAGFLLDPLDAGNLFVKSEPGQLQATISLVESTFEEVLPDVPLHYDFVDEYYNARYSAEILTGKLADYFAVISIFISCLGLLGLITFIAEQKTRELGIRKILGASLFSLMKLLSKDFIRLVFIAFIFAIPISFYAMQNWLDKFTYQVNIHWVPIFLFAGLSAILLTLITIGYKSLQAGRHNPVESLRSE